MIAFITFYNSLVLSIEDLCSSNPWEFELSGFRRNRTDNLGIRSPLLWPTEPRLDMRYENSVQRRKGCPWEFYNGVRSSDHRSKRLNDIGVHECLCIYVFTLVRPRWFPLPMPIALPSYPLARHPLCLPPGPREGFPSSHERYCKEPDNQQVRRTQDGRAAALTLFVFVLAATCTILQEGLILSLPPTQHPCAPQNFTHTSLPTTPLNLIAISFVCDSVL